jgi:hypothetical protein
MFPVSVVLHSVIVSDGFSINRSFVFFFVRMLI